MIARRWRQYLPWGLLGQVLFLSLLASPSSAQKLNFHLVAEEDWNEGKPPRTAFLTDGRIYLFRPGEYRPQLELAANEPSEVPPGRWIWTAEAPGYVNVGAGSLTIPKEFVLPEGMPPTKGIVWQVFPACEIDLISVDRWQGLKRLDLVSLDRQAVYPIDPRDRLRFQIPIGRFLAYSVVDGGIQAISQIQRCRAGETYELPRPRPPSSEHQHLMVSAKLPERELDLAVFDRQKLTANLEPLRTDDASTTQSPTASLWVDQRVTFFFLDVDAGESLSFRVRHPELLTHRQTLPPEQDRVRELPDVLLEARIGRR